MFQIVPKLPEFLPYPYFRDFGMTGEPEHWSLHSLSSLPAQLILLPAQGAYDLPFISGGKSTCIPSHSSPPPLCILRLL